MEIVKGILGGSFGIVWMLAGPITYIICVVDTWSGRSEVWLKIVINLTLDAFLAFIWPITWMLWGVMYLAGAESPLTRALGL
jgi:hypothetical protein